MLQSDHKQNAWRRKFTLLEMMVVLVMIAILLAVIVPAFQKISTGSAVNAASRMLAAQFRLARAEAIARREYIAVILPGEHFIQDSDEENPPVYRYQSFRSAIVRRTDAGFEFVEWVEGTQWTFLPTGALVAEADDDAFTTINITDDDEDEEDWTLALNDKPYELIELINDISEPKSRMTIPADEDGNSRWFIADNNPILVDEETYEGSTESDQVFDSSRCLFPGFSGSTILRYLKDVASVSVRAVIFKPNGRCVQKTYVTIMEGIFTVPDPTVPEDTNQDPVEVPVNESEPAFERENKFNIRVMEISPFTGKVRFLY